MIFEGEHISCPKWFQFALSGIGLASLALSYLFW